MSVNGVDVAIVGAGPYGLSLAAHLQAAGVEHRVFGKAMSTWDGHMPAGMHLKSDGFASNLADPRAVFTLAKYNRETGADYADVGVPVELNNFVEYGKEFQRRMVPHLEAVDVSDVRSAPGGVFQVTTESGERFRAKRVVLAVGITHFAFLPQLLRDRPREWVTHSSQHKETVEYRGRRIVVVGGGASAVDLAATLVEAGADVHLMARRGRIDFHEPSPLTRSWKQRVMNPRSGLGLGWRSRLCTDAPLIFHAMPEKFRHRVVDRHLGPSCGWSVRKRVEGRVPMHLGAHVEGLEQRDGRLALTYRQGGESRLLSVDHVIAATGYRPSVDRLKFVDESLRRQMAATQGMPVLDRNFESSIKGMYMVGLASAPNFGPLCRFVYGSKFTSQHLSRRLARTV